MTPKMTPQHDDWTRWPHDVWVTTVWLPILDVLVCGRVATLLIYFSTGSFLWDEERA